MNEILKRSTTTLRAAVLCAIALAHIDATSAEQGSIIVGKVVLTVPSDSHEPQRALVDLRNAGSDRVADVIVACRFVGGTGSDLETVEVHVREVASRTTVQTSATYYGWPRATRATCRRP